MFVGCITGLLSRDLSVLCSELLLECVSHPLESNAELRSGLAGGAPCSQAGLMEAEKLHRHHFIFFSFTKHDKWLEVLLSPLTHSVSFFLLYMIKGPSCVSFV